MVTGNVKLEYALSKNLIRDTAASDRPSSSRNTEGFCLVAGKSARSVLHHKVGLPLACYLHGGGSSTVDDDVARLYFPNVSAKGVVRADDHDRIFQESFNFCKARRQVGETQFTAKLTENIQQSLNLSRRAWSVEKEHPVVGGRTRGRIDILVQRHGDNKQGAASSQDDEQEQGGSAEEASVLLVEVGLKNEEWWAKVNQAYEYLECLKNFHGPLLLTAITFEPKGGQHRIGVFLVTPRGRPSGGPGNERKFATSLLWRSQETSIEELSQSFGRVLRAARLLVEWDEAETSYQYLGPNCCLIEPEVTSICVISGERSPARAARVTPCSHISFRLHSSR
jgi:hypothetical protein